MAQQTGKALGSRSQLTPRPLGGESAPSTLALPVRPHRDFVETVWVLFCSLRFAVVLNVALALAAMLGTVVPQLPPGIRNFPTEYENFVSGVRGRYGDFAGVLDWAGFFDLYNSLWFRMLVVLVVFSIIMCTMNRWGPIMRLIRNPSVRVGDAFLAGLSEKAQFRSVPLTGDAAESALRSALKKSRYRTLREAAAGDNTVYIYADRDRWSKLVTFVSHAALVLLILAAAGFASFGWREQSVFFYPGKEVNVGHGTDFSVRHDSFWIEYYPDGKTVKEYRDTLTVIEDGKEVLTKTIIVNDPLRYDGVNFFLVSYQPVLYATANDASGNPLPLRRMGSSGIITETLASGETLVSFEFISGDNLPMDLLQLAAGEKILTLELTYYQDVERAQGENPPVYVRGYVDKDFDNRVYDGFLPRTGAFVIPGFEAYSFAFRQDTASVLEVAKDPGLGLVAFFFFIMTAGFTASLYTTFTRCWAKISPSAENPGTLNITLAGLAEKNKVSFERDFERLAARANDSLAEAVSNGSVEGRKSQVSSQESAT